MVVIARFVHGKECPEGKNLKQCMKEILEYGMQVGKRTKRNNDQDTFSFPDIADNRSAVIHFDNKKTTARNARKRYQGKNDRLAKKPDCDYLSAIQFNTAADTVLASIKANKELPSGITLALCLEKLGLKEEKQEEKNVLITNQDKLINNEETLPQQSIDRNTIRWNELHFEPNPEKTLWMLENLDEYSNEELSFIYRMLIDRMKEKNAFYKNFLQLTKWDRIISLRLIPGRMPSNITFEECAADLLRTPTLRRLPIKSQDNYQFFYTLDDEINPTSATIPPRANYNARKLYFLLMQKQSRLAKKPETSYISSIVFSSKDKVLTISIDPEHPLPEDISFMMCLEKLGIKNAQADECFELLMKDFLEENPISRHIRNDALDELWGLEEDFEPAFMKEADSMPPAKPSHPYSAYLASSGWFAAGEKQSSEVQELDDDCTRRYD